jgi:hypothetical protein
VFIEDYRRLTRNQEFIFEEEEQQEDNLVQVPCETMDGANIQEDEEESTTEITTTSDEEPSDEEYEPVPDSSEYSFYLF